MPGYRRRGVKRRKYGRRGRSYRRYSKKARSSRRSLILNKRLPTGLVFPDVYLCKLVYRQNFSLTTSTGFVYNLFRGNSLFDPDQSGTGHQPYYRDQLATLYNNYRVLGSKITVVFTSGTDGLGYVGVAPQTTTSAPSVLTDMMEEPYGRYKATTGYQAKGQTIVKNYMKTKKMFGMKSILYDDTCAAAMGSNPTQQWYWNVWGIAVDSLNISQFATVQLTYYVRCENRVLPGGS